MNPWIQKTLESLDAYRAGITVFEYDPAERPIKNMLHLVAYDICSPRRLRRVARICEDYGLRVEYSVFECDTSPEHFDQFWTRLCDAIDPEEDALLAYRICRECVKRIHSIGAVERPEPTLFYMV